MSWEKQFNKLSLESSESNDRDVNGNNISVLRQESLPDPPLSPISPKPLDTYTPPTDVSESEKSHEQDPLPCVCDACELKAIQEYGDEGDDTLKDPFGFTTADRYWAMMSPKSQRELDSYADEIKRLHMQGFIAREMARASPDEEFRLTLDQVQRRLIFDDGIDSD